MGLSSQGICSVPGLRMMAASRPSPSLRPAAANGVAPLPGGQEVITMRHARSARFIAIGASVALLALATLAAPASAGNTRDVYFGSPVVDGGTGGGYDASGAPISGTLSPLNSVTSGSAVAVRVRVANDGKQTLNKVSFLGGALADGAAYNPLFPKPSDPSLDSDLRFLASYPLNGAPACDPVPASGLQLRCYLGTLASGASAEYLVVIGTSSGAIDAQPFWLTASWNEGWSTTGTNADYQFAVGSVLVGEASCVEAAGYFLANSAVAIGNTGLSGCTQQTTVQTAAVGGIGTFAKVKVGGGTPTSCDAVGLRCFGDDSSVTVYGGNPVGGGVLWTIRWDPLTINGKPKGVVHFLDAYYKGVTSAWVYISFSKQNECNETTTVINCWTSIDAGKTYFEASFRTPSNGGARGAY